MNAAKLDFPNESFDAIFDFGIIHHIPNGKDCIAELRRGLKEDGELILTNLGYALGSHSVVYFPL